MLEKERENDLNFRTSIGSLQISSCKKYNPKKKNKQICTCYEEKNKDAFHFNSIIRTEKDIKDFTQKSV